MMEGLFYLAMVGAGLAAGGIVAAVLVWGLYVIQGGRLGLAEWFRRM